MKAAKLAVLFLCAAVDVFGQPSAAPSTFEVASVKPSAPDVAGMFIRPLPGGGLQVAGASLKNLISLAYGVRAFQIVGASSWVDSERFDLDARTATSDTKGPPDPAADRRKLLEGLKSLLADRFQLLLHSDTRDQAVFALVVNKGGPKLQESTEPRTFIRKLGRGTLKAQAVPVGMLTLNLSNELGRRVIDRTGLTAKYDFELKWGGSEETTADPEGPSLFTALQEQLGLRLESERGPVEVLVIDRAERPSKN